MMEENGHELVERVPGEGGAMGFGPLTPRSFHSRRPSYGQCWFPSGDSTDGSTS